jgi:hypothetical protein
MSESSPHEVKPNEYSPEWIAYRLTQTIASNEGKSLWIDPNTPATTDRRWLLDTYAECLQTVKNPGKRLNR